MKSLNYIIFNLILSYLMPRVCYLSGKKTVSWNMRSHSMRATKRSFKVNIQNKKISFGGLGLTMKVSTRMYKKLRGFI